MRDTAGSAAAPAARCRNCRRGSFIAPSLKIEVTVRLPGNHSGLMLAARITLAHFSVSSAMGLPKPAGEPTSGVLPKSASRALIVELARPALISVFNVATISEGVCLGAPRPYHALYS